MVQTLATQSNQPYISNVTLLFQIPVYCLKENFNLIKLSKVCVEVCQECRVEFTELKITPVLGRGVGPNKPVTNQSHPLMYLVLMSLKGTREDLNVFSEWWCMEVLKHPTKYFTSNMVSWVDSIMKSNPQQNTSPSITKKLLQNHTFPYEPMFICEVFLPLAVKAVQVYFEEHSLAWQLRFPSLKMDDTRVFDFEFLLDKILFQIATSQGLFPMREKDLNPFFDESISILFPSPAEWGLTCKIDKKPYP